MAPSRRSVERGFTPLKRSAQQGFAPSKRSAEHGFTPLRRSAQLGFTLIEMMVALIVFSLAAMALIRLEGASFRTASQVDRSVIANIVARNVAVEALTAARMPTRGLTQGVEDNGGRRWRWTQQASGLGDGNAMRIDIAVADDRGQTAARLMVVRPALAPAVTGNVQ